MDLIYILLIGAAVLVIAGIIWRFLSKTPGKIEPVAPKVLTPPKPVISPTGPNKPAPTAPRVQPAPPPAVAHKSTVDIELVDLRTELKAMVGGVGRVYEDNLQIGRDELSKSGITDPSEKAILKCAIKLLIDDRNRR
jgi:hypothetical protein